MIEISHEMIRYGTHIKDILCCDCFYDEIYFMLRQKVVCQKFEERFEDVENCYFKIIYGASVVICYDVLLYADKKYSLFDRKKCITDLVNDIEICSICITDVFRKNNILHTFKLKW